MMILTMDRQQRLLVEEEAAAHLVVVVHSVDSTKGQIRDRLRHPKPFRLVSH